MGSHRLKTWWPFLVVLAIIAAYNLPLLSPHRVSMRNDATRLYYPCAHELADALTRGSLPTWVSGIQSGFPLVADPLCMALYPVSWVVLSLLAPPSAYDTILILHQMLALVFMFAWGRILGLRSGPSAGMGLLFVLTTSLVSESAPLLATTAWIPLLFVVTERAVRSGRARSAWPITPIVALQWLSGYPQLALYSVALAGLFAVLRVFEESKGWFDRLRMAGGWSAAVLLGLALAAPQILATYELSSYSLRAGSVPEGLAAERSLFPAALLTFVLPSLRRFILHAGLGSAAYIGMVPFVLAVATMFGGPRSRGLRALLIVTVVATLIALGSFGPLFPLLRRVPGFSYFRLPSRVLVFSQFGLITFFAVAWNAWYHPAGTRTRRMAKWLLLACAVLFVATAIAHPLLVRLRPQLTHRASAYVLSSVAGQSFHLQPPAYYERKIDRLYGDLLAATDWQRPNLLIPGAAVVAFLLLSVVAARLGGGSRTVRRWIVALAAGVVLIDVLAAAGWQHWTAPLSEITTPPGTLALTAAPPCRIHSVMDARAVVAPSEHRMLLPANYNLLFDRAIAGVYHPLAIAAYYELLGRLGGVDLAFGQRPVTATDVERGRALLDFLGVCNLLSREPLTGFERVGEAEGVTVYRNPRALPVGFVVDRAEVVESQSAALAWMHAQGERLRETAVLEAELSTPLETGSASRAVVRRSDPTPTVVNFDVKTPGTVLLVVSETHYPGWSARLDDRPVSIYRANAVFRAVVVPAGTHQIEFTYRPRALRLGGAIAAVALVLLAGWFLFLTLSPAPAQTGDCGPPLPGEADRRGRS